MHNHPPTGTDLDGHTHVKKVVDMEAVELEKLETLAITSAGMAHIKESMSIHFPERDFDVKLLERETNKILDRRFGTNREQMGELLAKGRRALQNGGVWEPEVGETLRIVGCNYQTATQRAYAYQYGGYYYTADGTYGTTKHNQTTVPFVSTDCLGILHPVGSLVSKTENGPDIMKAAHLFGLSSVPSSNAEVTQVSPVTTIEGIPLGNLVLQNSHGGHIATDEAPWSFGTAEDIGKSHGLCCRHKSNGILKSQSGLAGRTQSYINDMHKIIYNIYDSLEELDEKIRIAREKYGDNPPSRTFIDSVDQTKHLLCATYMQYVFTFGHCTTAIGESWNSMMKGQGELKQYLAKSNMFTLLNIIDRMARSQDIEAVKQLKKLRQAEMRWSAFFQEHYNQYRMLAGTNIRDVNRVADSDGMQWDTVDMLGRVFRVNLATKIVHRGRVYVIPTCECGMWCSLFIWCPCIIRCGAMQPDFELESVHNVHPFHLIQLHPMWEQALKETNLSDYDDFPDLRPSEVHLSNTAVLNEDCNIVTTRRAESSTDRRDTLPVQFYNKFRNGCMAEEQREKVNTLRELANELIAVSVNNGDDEKYKIAHCRILQAISECEGNVDLSTGLGAYRSPTQTRRRRTTPEDLVNKSTLNIGMRVACGKRKGGGGRSKNGQKKAKTSNSSYEQFQVKQLSQLLKAINAKKTGGPKAEQIEKLETNQKTKELGELSVEQLKLECRSLDLSPTGDRLTLLLRLLFKHFGTAPSMDPAVAAALNP